MGGVKLSSGNGLSIACLLGIAILLAGCGKEPVAPGRKPPDVTVMTVTARDTPVTFEFVAQTQSSREVEIRARVAGFLEKRLYTEGDLVKAGQTLFQMDSKPFDAALLSAKGQLAQQQARWEVAKATLARVRPLAAQNAVSKMDLDNANGQERETHAAVLAAEGVVRNAQLNLSYTTITSPLTGLSSYAKKQDGSYVTPGESGLLTSVSQMDPMYVNFSLSENESLKYRDEISTGRLKIPPSSDFVVEVVMADGTVVPDRGRVNFLAPSFSSETGTFLVRAVLANPKGLLKPGQFVKALAKGATRPNAILVPQKAVLEGAKSHFVWVLNAEGKPEQRVVEVGEWQGDNWFISQGLHAGERIVVEGAIRVTPGGPLNIVDAAGTTPAPAETGETVKAGTTGATGGKAP
ncbi:efflux RND transporter periplasmic adaptor subunit [Pseudomonas izuensis]|uniref:Efflux RND transporter periplasmic adaptor subunit n=1 Tax=Pseudomonas izuensis TaxID=2684212 RepID=A0ABM7S0Q2_9PSED|nr:efflux RND transporter periplasmic adaptor subunit [Pseudomonas izuensis]BCX68308.1 efflux RND transporter periplasmic adaptor subunit [Pseudomonas izuensis]